ncbi:hypothetical protein B0A49_09937 [Cryomyces minteri]|uniref:DUF3500 domain-containing protein n=1 Tax=Cryomyces minteri TaxID=331657 RepID=A0A4U0WNG1_9PEZI|nr:hypothetical protein B0A49_09937 [Cryomyces minteri]
MSKAAFDQIQAEYRQYLPDLSSSRLVIAKEQDARTYADAFKATGNPPWLYELTQTWNKLYHEPFHGITSSGDIIPNLFTPQDEGVDVEPIVDAVEAVIAELDPALRAQLLHPINAPEWRAWSNPEILLRPFGVRLDEIDEAAARLILYVLEASFSAEGYAKAIAAMRINHFLGEICEVPRIMNKYSYNFLVFGTPSVIRPWGWSLYGHHLCLNVFVRGRQMAISPTFTGAEPNIIDSGPWLGTAILHTEGELGLRLMQSLPKDVQKAAQKYERLRDPKMLQTGDLSIDRWNKDDQRHLCGAFRDNRIVAYEGVLVSDMTPEQQQLVVDISEQFLLYLPDSARTIRKKQIQSHFDHTYFSWIGGYGDSDAFYYRVQSPIIIFEFDHHSGVFLTNQEPAKFHTHTIVRTPNGGDYGNALRGESERLR